jgi:uncharacterized protein YyaL (SSP411 family)
MQFMLEKMRQADGISLFHTYKDGRTQYDAFLDDYAFLIDALIAVYEISFDTSYLLQAGRYTDYVIEHFFDNADKMFYFTSFKQKDVPMRKKDLYDSATPSGNSVMVRNLQRLGILLENEGYRTLAADMLLKMKDAVVRYPSSFGLWASAMADEVFGMPEIAVVGSQAFETAHDLNREYLPAKVLMASADGDEGYALLAGKGGGADTFIYVCQNYACQKPVETIEGFKQLLKQHQSSNLAG